MMGPFSAAREVSLVCSQDFRDSTRWIIGAGCSSKVGTATLLGNLISKSCVIVWVDPLYSHQSACRFRRFLAQLMG